jgi:hypothetical protein
MGGVQNEPFVGRGGHARRTPRARPAGGLHRGCDWGRVDVTRIKATRCLGGNNHAPGGIRLLTVNAAERTGHAQKFRNSDMTCVTLSLEWTEYIGVNGVKSASDLRLRRGIRPGCHHGCRERDCSDASSRPQGGGGVPAQGSRQITGVLDRGVVGPGRGVREGAVQIVTALAEHDREVPPDRGEQVVAE